MDKEVSSAVEIGVTLIVLSLVISLVWYTVFLGKGVENDAVTFGVQITSSMQEGVVEDMVGLENDMTTASFYGIARAYGRYLPKVDCKICGKVTDLTKETPCMLSHMHGKVSVDVKYVDSWYEVVVHKENCTWFTGVCTCYALP